LNSDKPSKEVNAFVVPSVSTNVALKGIFPSTTKDHPYRSHERVFRLNGNSHNLLQEPTEDQTGSDITLSKSAGRVLPDDREPGAQSEDLRNGGVAHAILCFQISQIPPCRLPACDESHLMILRISSSEREVARVCLVVVSLWLRPMASCDGERAVDGPGSVERTVGVWAGHSTRIPTSTDAVAQDLDWIEDVHRAKSSLTLDTSTLPLIIATIGFDCVLLAAPILSKTARKTKAKKSTVPYQSTQSIPQQNVTKTIIAAVQSTAIKGFIDTDFRPNRDKLTLIVRKSPARSQSNAPSRVPAEGLEARHG
jgi:hypothetical protein